MINPLFADDHSDENPTVYRAALHITANHCIQRFANSGAGLRRALTELTEEYLETGSGGMPVVTGMGAQISFIEEIIADREERALQESEDGQLPEWTIRARQNELSSLEDMKKAHRRAEFMAEFLENRNSADLFVPNVTTDARIDDVFQEGDDRDSFTLAYRFLQDLWGYDLVIEQVKIY